MGELVKLYVYQHLPEETIIDVYEAKCWDDFVVVKTEGVPEEHLWAVSNSVKRYADDHPEKQVFLVGENSDITFYGVRPEGEDEAS